MKSPEDMKRLAAAVEQALNGNAKEEGRTRTIFALVLANDDEDGNHTVRFVANADPDHMKYLLADLVLALEKGTTIEQPAPAAKH